MKVQNLIQASANVLKITSLNIGDVVKQVDSSYSGTEIYYGVVTDMMNSGEQTFIQIMRYKKNYGSIDCDVKVYKGGEDLALFPATVSEVKEHLQDCIEALKKSIVEDEKKLANKKDSLQNAIDFVSMESSKKLTEASFKEVTQVEYNRIKEGSQF